jgi:hypothetical protein
MTRAAESKARNGREWKPGARRHRPAWPALLSVLVVAHSCAYCSRTLVAPARVPMAKHIRALYTGARIVGGDAVETAR